MAARRGAVKATEPKAPEATEPKAPEATEPKAPEATEPKAPEATEPDSAATPGYVEYRMVVSISGTRNGEPWPSVGQPIVLPADEGEQYARLGYVAAQE